MNSGTQLPSVPHATSTFCVKHSTRPRQLPPEPGWLAGARPDHMQPVPPCRALPSPQPCGWDSLVFTINQHWHLNCRVLC